MKYYICEDLIINLSLVCFIEKDIDELLIAFNYLNSECFSISFDNEFELNREFGLLKSKLKEMI